MWHSWRILLIVLVLWWGSLPAAVPGKVVVLDVTGVIGPATSDYVHRSLEQAWAQQAALVVLRMDTPGGLDLSMRSIIQDMLASPVPIAVYVAPKGARAASAGTYILYASHIAAMAPATNLGAATPVQLASPLSPDDQGKQGTEKVQPAPSGDSMKQKMINDAQAYIRSLAQMRGRNVEWAEQAVREAASLTAEEALAIGVIEIIAKDIPHLLAQVEGRVVQVAGETQTVTVAGSEVSYVVPDWRSQVLAIISDPNIAYILMLLGIYGLIYEFANPGMIFPGVVGAICLVLAMFAFQVLPINYAGLGLILLGIAFMVGEVFVPSFGALGIGGVIAFVIGSIVLMDTGVPGYDISLPVIVAFSLLSAIFFITVVSLALKARQRPVVSGREELLGSIGEAVEDFQGLGRVHVHSELWNARSVTALKRGQRVRVIGVDGLILEVEPLSDNMGG